MVTSGPVRPGRVLHPRHGPHHPAAATPGRRPGSVRRTVTHDSFRPEGPLGPVHLRASGRDLLTGADGSARIVGEASLEAVVAYLRGQEVESIEARPPVEGLASLVGRCAGRGFRRAVGELLERAGPPAGSAASLRDQLLDEMAPALMVAGYVLPAAGIHPPPGRFDPRSRADVCAGWAAGATILVEAEVLGHPPVPTGPAVPEPLTATDPLAWHRLGEMVPHAMRRWRRVDVWPEGDLLRIESFFRDSHMDAYGLETVVHEYTVMAAADRDGLRLVDCRARAGALPWLECPAALASAARVVGTAASEIGRMVRGELAGPSTCTHLNDTLRGLERLPHLVGVLAGG